MFHCLRGLWGVDIKVPRGLVLCPYLKKYFRSHPADMVSRPPLPLSNGRLTLLSDACNVTLTLETEQCTLKKKFKPTLSLPYVNVFDVLVRFVQFQAVLVSGGLFWLRLLPLHLAGSGLAHSLHHCCGSC